ncbi:MAG TPA: M16 family metallopeptidase [Cyclobacteriaceae bacterium]
MLDRSIAPASYKPDDFKVLKVNKRLSRKGHPIHYIHTPDHNVVRLEVLLKSGELYSSGPGTSYFTTKMLIEGTRKKHSSDISELFEFYGAQIDIQSGFDYNSMIINVLTKYLQEIIILIEDLFLESTLPEKELDSLKNIRLGSLRINKEKTSYVSSRQIREVLFGKQHPYGRILEEDHIHEVTRKEISTFYHNNLFNSPEVFISGSFEESHLERLVSLLDNIETHNNPAKDKEIVTLDDAIIPMDGSQSSIKLGKHLIDKAHPDYIKLYVANELFGGFFGSRLMKNIREDKGLTYGIYSTIINLKNASFWVIGSEVKRELAKQALSEIEHELIELQYNKVPADELELVKNYTSGNLILNTVTPAQHMDRYKSIYLSGLDYNFYDTLFDEINSVSVEDIQEMANTHFDIKEIKKVIVGELAD